jgi:hypothetical protein
VQTTSDRLSGLWWMASEVSEARRSCEHLTDLWAPGGRGTQGHGGLIVPSVAVCLANLGTPAGTVASEPRLTGRGIGHRNCRKYEASRAEGSACNRTQEEDRLNGGNGRERTWSK